MNANYVLVFIVTSTTILLNVACGQNEFYNDGNLILVASNGLAEPPTSIYHNGNYEGEYDQIQAFNKIDGVNSWPLVFADLATIGYTRGTYQTPTSSATLATSFVAAPWYRRQNEGHSLPTISRADVSTAGQAYSSTLTGTINSQESNISLTRSLAEPIVGLTQHTASVHFEANQNINLDTSATFVGNDRFRVSFVSSMFASEEQFDANLIRYEDSNGLVQEIRLLDSTSRDSFLLSNADEIGSWIELIKEPNKSSWNPGSPSIRIEVLNSDLSLGIQGYLAGTQDPNDDSLSVWLEWMDAPDQIASGTEFDVSFQVSYFAAIPEPSQLTAFFGFVAMLCSRRRQRYKSSADVSLSS